MSKKSKMEKDLLNRVLEITDKYKGRKHMAKAKKKTIFVHEVYQSIKDVRDIYKMKVTEAEHREILQQIEEGEFEIPDNAKFVRRDLDADAATTEIYTEKEQKGRII